MGRFVNAVAFGTTHRDVNGGAVVFRLLFARCKWPGGSQVSWSPCVGVRKLRVRRCSREHAPSEDVRGSIPATQHLQRSDCRAFWRSSSTPPSRRTVKGARSQPPRRRTPPPSAHDDSSEHKAIVHRRRAALARGSLRRHAPMVGCPQQRPSTSPQPGRSAHPWGGASKRQRAPTGALIGRTSKHTHLQRERERPSGSHSWNPRLAKVCAQPER